MIKLLFKILKRGIWTEKIKAADAIAHVYKTFCTDFTSPEQTIINPLLEFTQDDAPKVRKYVCKILPQFGVWTENLIGALISRLADHEPSVKRAAKRALIELGIDSKHELYQVMRWFGIFNRSTAVEKKYGKVRDSKSMDWLDV